MDWLRDVPFATKFIELDLGCGKGGFLAGMAEKYPDHFFLGVERQQGRVLKTQKKLNRLGISNARVVLGNIRECAEQLPGASIDRMHVLFPDPWPKRRHHLRRLFNREFLDATYRLLKRGGRLRFMTDDEAYFCFAKKLAEADERFRFVEEEERIYVRTDFQEVFEAQGKVIHLLVLEKSV